MAEVQLMRSEITVRRINEVAGKVRSLARPGYGSRMSSICQRIKIGHRGRNRIERPIVRFSPLDRKLLHLTTPSIRAIILLKVFFIKDSRM